MGRLCRFFEAQGVAVGADTDGLGGVLPLHGDVGGVAVVVGDGVAYLGGVGLDDGLDGVVVDYGAGGVDEAAHGIYQIRKADAHIGFSLMCCINLNTICIYCNPCS